MTDNDIFNKVKNNYRFFLEIAFIFSLLLAIGYSWGYWSTFKINIFPFISVSDLIKSTAYPLLLVIPYLLLQIFIFEFCRINISFFHLSNTTILSIIMLISVFSGLWVKSITLIFGIPTAIFIYIHIANKYFNEVKIIRIILMLTILVFLSYDVGRFNAKNIYNNHQYSFSFLTNVFNKAEKIKYLGYVNNHYFFITPDNNSLYILKASPQVQLQLFSRKHATNDVMGQRFT